MPKASTFHPSPKQRAKMVKVFHEFGKKKLKSHGKVITDVKQAVAIAISEAKKV